MNRLHEFDLTAFRAINVGWHHGWLDPFFEFFSYLGLGIAIGAVCLLFALHKSTRHYVIPLILADAVSGFLVADGLKALIYRDRPSNLDFAIVQEPLHLSSFPSGHTTTAFAIATMLVFLTWTSKFNRLGWLSFGVAALIGLSRIYRGVHWPTDVLAGAFCGIATSCFLYFILPKLKIRVF